VTVTKSSPESQAKHAPTPRLPQPSAVVRLSNGAVVTSGHPILASPACSYATAQPAPGAGKEIRTWGTWVKPRTVAPITLLALPAVFNCLLQEPGPVLVFGPVYTHPVGGPVDLNQGRVVSTLGHFCAGVDDDIDGGQASSFFGSARVIRQVREHPLFPDIVKYAR
jgi:hypothetical protein